MPVSGGGLTTSPGAVTITLQADFSGTAFGSAPTWTDITGWWMSSSKDPGGSPTTIPWGRQDQASTVETSSASFVLNNADGRFTPGRATLVTGGPNPYYPNVRRHVRMRLTITDGTTTGTLFDGYVDTWTITPQTDGPPTATADLSDAFSRLQAATTLRSFMQETILLLPTPAVYLPLTDDSTATAPELLAGPNGAVASIRQSKYGGGSFAFGSGKPLAAEGQPTLTLTPTSSTQGYVADVAANPLITTGPSGSIQIRVNWSGTGVSGTIAGIFASSGAALTVGVDASGQALAMYSGSVTPLIVAAGTHGGGTVTVNDGVKHEFVVILSKGGGNASLTLTVDSTHTFTDTDTFGTVAIAQRWTNLQAGGQITPTGVTGLLGGDYSHLGVNPGATAADMWHAGLDAFAGESTSTRWARLLTYRPNIGGTTTGTVGTVGSGDIAGMSLGDALTDTAVAEGGVVQTNRGTISLIGRSATRNPATTLTLDAAQGQVDLPTTWRDDAQGFLNDVTVTRTAGATQRVVNAVSVTADGEAQTSITANVNSDADARDMAGWLVAVGTQETVTSPTLTVNLYARADPTLTLAVCGLKTYDIAALANLPTSAPATAMRLQVQGGQYTVGADTFTAELYTTAPPPAVLQVKAVADTTTALDTGNVISW